MLSNTGARTAGVDGIDKDALMAAERKAFIEDLQRDLKAGTYQPQPVRRAWIDKPGKKEKRGLGIPTLRDRVVQEMLRMLFEPIWESDFLDCSNGFRPGRRTMDCIATFYRRVTTQNKFFWAVEGDIRKCFDRIHHGILLKQIRRRIADERIVALVEACLTAGVMEGALFQEKVTLLANIYLVSGVENGRRGFLVRYADDFVILWNGTHQDALALKEEFKQFLWDELHLELSEEKTQVTHLTEGIDFLGFHIRYMVPKQGRKPWLRITPTKQNLQRFRAKIKALTERGTTCDPEMRFKGHGMELYVLVFGVSGEMVLSLNWAIRIKQYRPTKRENPYLVAEDILEPEAVETPFLDPRIVNLPPKALAWKKQRARVLKRDKGCCQQCGTNRRLLDVSHYLEQGGTDVLDNLITLCRECHAKTLTYGFNAKREEKV